MPKSPESGPAKKPKFYYGWLIVWLSFATLGFHVVTRFSFGIFQVPLLEEFGWSRGLLSGAFSLSMGHVRLRRSVRRLSPGEKRTARHHALGFGDTRRHFHRVFLRVLALAPLHPVRAFRRLWPVAERFLHAQRHHAALVRQKTRPRHGNRPLGHRNQHPHPGPLDRAAHRVGRLALHVYDLRLGRVVRPRARKFPAHARRGPRTWARGRTATRRARPRRWREQALATAARARACWRSSRSLGTTYAFGASS